MGAEVLALVETIHKDKNLEKEKIFQLLQEAVTIAIKESRLLPETTVVTIDQKTGEIKISCNKDENQIESLNRIIYNRAREIFLQELQREESNIIYSKYKERIGDIILCTIEAVNRDGILCRLEEGAMGLLPKQEQIPGEFYKIGSKIKVYLLKIEKRDKRIKGRNTTETEIILSRACPEFLAKLLTIEVPEIGDNIIKIKKIVRDPGYRAKVLVESKLRNVTEIGSCVGLRAGRIRNIVNEISGENIDIIEWSDDPVKLITNAFKPVQIREIRLNFKRWHAKIYTDKEDLPRAIGKNGRNIRLISQITNWDIDVAPFEPQTQNERKEG